jgi:signal transduction histidine kinase
VVSSDHGNLRVGEPGDGPALGRSGRVRDHEPGPPRGSAWNRSSRAATRPFSRGRVPPGSGRKSEERFVSDATAPGSLRTAANVRAHDAVQFVAGIMAMTAASRHTSDPIELRRVLDQIEELASAAAATLVGEPHDGGSEVVRLDDVVRLVADTASASYGVTVECTLRPVSAVGDRVTWRRILSNLVDNAARASAAGQPLTVTVDERSGRAELTVANHGPMFGSGPSGRGSHGLVVVISEVHRMGGTVEFCPVHPSGVLVRLVVPAA